MARSPEVCYKMSKLQMSYIYHFTTMLCVSRYIDCQEMNLDMRVVLFGKFWEPYTKSTLHG